MHSHVLLFSYGCCETYGYQKLMSHLLESEVKVAVWLGSGEGPVPSWRLQLLATSSYNGKKNISFLASSYKGTNTVCKGSTLTKILLPLAPTSNAIRKI